MKWVESVKSAAPVTGRFDTVVEVEAEGVEELGNLILKRIQRIRGIQSTETALVTE